MKIKKLIEAARLFERLQELNKSLLHARQPDVERFVSVNAPFHRVVDLAPVEKKIVPLIVDLLEEEIEKTEESLKALGVELDDE